jgi:hypothetical protein
MICSLHPGAEIVGLAIWPAAVFQAALSRDNEHAEPRLKAGGSQDWLPYSRRSIAYGYLRRHAAPSPRCAAKWITLSMR